MTEQNESLLAKLDQIDARYSEIDNQIAQPEIATDPTRLVALSKEQGKLKAIVSKYREYKKGIVGIEETRQILSDDSAEEDLKALAQEEMQQLEDHTNILLDEIVSSIVMADDMDILVLHSSTNPICHTSFASS